MFTLPSTATQWLQGLIAAVIGGGASAGQSWLAMSTAHAIGIDVPILNFKALGIIMLSAALASMLAFLAKSPIPTTTKSTTLTVTQETIDGKV